tara:strand:- start:303 stop:1046 length:744 start_codon:yes stop_codon:yes gene_type:complete
MKDIAFEKMFEFDSNHFWYIGREEIALSFISNNMNDSIERILDYGCGTGRLIVELQKKYNDKEIVGADSSDKSLGYCRDRGILKLVDLKKENNFHNDIDMIVCLDVLEHIEDDEEFLIKMKTMLRAEKEKGLLLITVPAYDFLWSGEDYVSRHFRRYTKRVLYNKLLKVGFEVRRISYFNTFLLLPYVFLLVGKRILLPKTMYQSDFKNVNKYLNKFLAKIFSFEKLLLNKVSFPFGASIVVVAKKK